jgi:hypothetical protein
MHQHVGVVRVEVDRPIHVPDRLVELSPVEEDASEHELDEGVPVVEGRRASGVVEGQALLVVPELPRLAAPLVEVREGNPRMGARPVRVERQGAFEESPDALVVLHGPPPETVEAPEPAVVDLKAGHRLSPGLVKTRAVDLDRQRARDASDDLVLDREQTLGGRVEAIRPDLTPGIGFDELHRHANGLSQPSDAALEKVADSQSVGPAVGRAAPPEREGGLGVDHLEGRKPRQLGDDVLDEPASEVLLLGITRRVLEGQDRDGRRRILGRGRAALSSHMNTLRMARAQLRARRS